MPTPDAGEALLANSDDARTAIAWIQPLLRRRQPSGAPAAERRFRARAPRGRMAPPSEAT